ncbi:hypothetical protein [Streptacidiphilus jiangxiensis]|uniref:Secreted protein n=1 Tax=Streptacidiphilus jiangxiensis TaxID=235985 RepID=A0A1H7HLW9_STRJI|nr:hypothetical protein [Streptacidiphilus jiangxiensis]SEK51314.1 hypothetical protein SAMN05414137_102271 [Streptacidiphilus jiangxiensis]
MTLAVLVGVVTVSAASGARDAWSTIGDRQAPQVVDATGLYQALTDLDAQSANIILFGADPAFASARSTALTDFATDRTTADRDLQQATLAAAGNAGAQQALASALDGLGQYQDLAGRSMALNDSAHRPAGHPLPAALTLYRQATDLMRSRLLPAADRLVIANNSAYETTYTAQRSALSTALVWSLVLLVALLAGLVAVQAWLTLRFRRVVNPALAAATLIATALLGLATSLFPDQREYQRVARHDAFDSVVALTRARALVADANADESRYLLDADRAASYQDSFLTTSQAVLTLPGATIADYDGQLASAVGAYRANHDDVRFQGFYGTEFRNITFPGERAAAERTLSAYQAYQVDDRKIRAFVAQGQLSQAIAYDTSYAAGGSDADFGAHDAALQQLIGVNADAFHGAVRDGSAELDTDLPLLAAGAAAVALLCLLGARPRLAEFRR